MAITTSTIPVPDFDNKARKLKTLNDSNDGSSNPAHPLLDQTGAIISPATSGKQDAANTALAAIQQAVARIPASPSTSTIQDAANTRLDTLIANTSAGSVNLSVSPTVTTGAYSSGMVVGGKISLAGAARVNGGSGLVQQASVNKKTNLAAAFDLFIFHTDPTTVFTDNTLLPDFSADFAKLAGVIRCTDQVDCGGPQSLQSLQQALAFKIAAANTTLFIVPVVRDNETYASTNALTINLAVLRD